MGAQCNTPAIITFQQNNVVGSSKRSVAAAMNIGSGAIGGIIGRFDLYYERVSDFSVPSSVPRTLLSIDLECMLLSVCSAFSLLELFSLHLSSGGGIGLRRGIIRLSRVSWDGGILCKFDGCFEKTCT
jgi:hypothetical protein